MIRYCICRGGVIVVGRGALSRLLVSVDRGTGSVRTAAAATVVRMKMGGRLFRGMKTPGTRGRTTCVKNGKKGNGERESVN